MKDRQILIVEDDLFTAEEIERKLKKMGLTNIKIALSYKKALKLIETKKFNLILLDVNLENGHTGIEIAYEKKVWNKIPIIYITGCDDIETQKEILDTKYESYLYKPIREQEFKMAISKALSLNENQEVKELSHNFTYEFYNRRVLHNGEPKKLSKYQTSLLEILIRANGGVVEKSLLEYEIWGSEPPSESSLRTLISSLKKRLHPDMIINVPSVGYKLV